MKDFAVTLNSLGLFQETGLFVITPDTGKPSPFPRSAFYVRRRAVSALFLLFPSC